MKRFLLFLLLPWAIVPAARKLGINAETSRTKLFVCIAYTFVVPLGLMVAGYLVQGLWGMLVPYVAFTITNGVSLMLSEG